MGWELGALLVPPERSRPQSAPAGLAQPQVMVQPEQEHRSTFSGPSDRVFQSKYNSAVMLI